MPARKPWRPGGPGDAPPLEKPKVYPKPEIPAQKPKFVKPEIPSEPPKEVFLTGPEFEKAFGVKLPTGWDVSYVWDEAETAPIVSVYAPGGVKLSLEDVGISPTGEWVYGEREPVVKEDRFAVPEGTLPVEERLEYFRYQAQLRLEDILSEVFITDEGVEQARTLAGEDPDAFIDAVAAIGRTDSTEDLLLELGLTEAELDMVFGPVLAELPTKEPDAVFFPLIGQIKQLTAEQKEAAPAWVKAFASGVGDVYSAAAGAARWLGYDSVGQTLSVEAERMHREYLYPTEQFEYETEDLLNPDFWEQFFLKVARAVPFALALAPVSIGTYFGGAALATAAGLGTIWAGIVGGITSGILSRPIESALEAGTQYDDAIARGKTEREAKEEADEVFRNNMVLAGADAFEVAIALAPTPKWVPNALLKGGLVRTARVAGKMVIVGLSEGGEEVYQDLISRRAKGEEWQWDPISKEVFAIGMVMGLGMGLGGDVITNIVNRSKEAMPADMKKDFDESVKGFKKEGFLLDQAELRALDIISQSPKGQGIVAKAIDEVKRFITEERGGIGRPEGETIERFKPILVTTQHQTPFVLPDGFSTNPNIIHNEKARELVGEPNIGKYMQQTGAIRVSGGVNEINIELQKLPTEAQFEALKIMAGDNKINFDISSADMKVLESGTVDNFDAFHRQVTESQFLKPPVVEEVKITEAVGNLNEGAWVQFKPDGIMYQITKLGKTRATLVDGEGNKSTISLSQAVYPLEARIKLLPKDALKPLPTQEITTKEAETNLAITGKPTLTPAQAEKTLSLFGKYVADPSTESAWELTRELRRETLAGRAENLKMRAQQLIIENGMNTEDAIRQATSETMSGVLPVADTDYLSDLTQDMREALFSKVYHVLKDKPLEMMSTTEALTNALLGKAIPREPGIRGGSAYTRLMRVFGDQPQVMKGLETNARESKPLEDVIEGVFRDVVEGGRPPIPVDEEMANYLRGLSTDVIYTPTAFRDPVSVTRHETPIEDAIKQMPMFPRTAADSIVSVLKEIAWGPVDIGNFLRANKASFDFSFWRQEGPMIINHPISFVHANIASWNATWSQKAAEASYERITRSPLYQIYEEYVNRTGRGDFLRPIDLVKGTEQWKGLEEFGSPTFERLIPRLVMKIPYIKFSARGFATGTNEHTWRIFKNHYEAMLELQEKYASGELKLKRFEVFSVEKEMSDLAEMLTDFTQRATLGKLKGLAPVLNSMFFAPRATLGRFLTPRHLVSSNPRIRMEAFRNLATFVTGIGGIVLLGEMLDLWDVEKDPHNAEYMSIRIGNIRVDPWAGYRQFLVFYTRMITELGISSVTGTEYVADPIRTMTNFVRGKASPFASLILDFWTGKNFIGEEVDVKNVRQWLERMSPFSIWDVYESYVLEPAKAAWIILPAILGAGVQAYTGEWIDNFHKLGVLKYTENLPYGVVEPVYDVKDFWADTATRFRGVDPATLTEDKGFPPYIRAIAEARIIKEHLSTLPNQTLVSLNTDPAEGATYADYYRMWQDREKIVLSGDEEVLKAFDKDERTRNAHLGNFSQQQFSLLNQYYAITDIGEQAKFLLKYKDEIGVNLRKAWLQSHPKENAQLAVWGQAAVLSKAAYDEARRLIDEFDIPHIAVDEYLPPVDVGEPYFEYLDLLIKGFSSGSPEVKLFRLENPELNNWGMDNLGWGSTVEWKGMEYYELDIKLEGMDAQYGALETTEERASFLSENTEYASDRRRRDALNLQFPEDEIETYIDWYTTKRSGYDDDWFLMENQDFYETMVDMKIWKPRDFSKVPTREVFKLYEQWEGMDKGKVRRDFEAANPELDQWLHLTKGTKLEPTTAPEEEAIPEAEKTRWPLPKNESIVTIYENKPMTRPEFLTEVKRLEEEEGYLPVPGGVSYGTEVHPVYSMKGAVNVEHLVEIYDFIKGEALFYISREQDSGKVVLWKREKYPQPEFIPEPWPWEEYEERGTVPHYLPEAVEGKEF